MNTLTVIQPQTDLLAIIENTRAGLSIASPEIAQRRPLADLVEATIIAACKSQHTARAYRRDIASFIDLLGEVRFNGYPLVGRIEAGKHKAARFDYGDTPAGVLLLVDAPLLDQFRKQNEQGVHAAKTLLAVAYRDNVLTDAQARAMGIKPYRAKVNRHQAPVGRRLTPMEVQMLRGAVDLGTIAGRRDRAILETMLYCGLRREEIANLRLDHFKQDSGRWTIVFKGKGGKLRRLFIPAPLFDSLSAWLVGYGQALGDEAPAFVQVRKGDHIWPTGLSPQAISDLVASYGARAGLAPLKGVSRLTPHDLRRTMAKRAYDCGAGLPAIQEALGHSDVKTTAHYIGVDDRAGASVTDLVGYD